MKIYFAVVANEEFDIRIIYSKAKFLQAMGLEREVLIQEADVGPIKYIAELIYGDSAKDMLDKAVRGLIIIFIFVFDPLVCEFALIARLPR